MSQQLAYERQHSVFTSTDFQGKKAEFWLEATSGELCFNLPPRPDIDRVLQPRQRGEPGT